MKVWLELMWVLWQACSTAAVVEATELRLGRCRWQWF
jgi:hypothetical protein